MISDLSPLTHFLIMRNCVLVPVYDLSKDKVPLGKRWQLVTQMVQQFWNRSSMKFLSFLQQRSKWLTEQPSLQVGALTLVTNEITPPGKWPLGKVMAIYPGKDQLVRVMDVKTATTTLRRPVVKLIVLPMDKEPF